MLSKEDLRLIGNLLDEKFDEKLTPIRDDIRVLKEDVVVLKEDVTVLKEDVAVLKEDVAVLKKDVRVLKKDVRNLKKEVTVLKKDVVTLKEGMVRLDNGIRDLRLDTIRIEKKLDEYYDGILRTYASEREERTRQLIEITEIGKQFMEFTQNYYPWLPLYRHRFVS